MRAESGHQPVEPRADAASVSPRGVAHAPAQAPIVASHELPQIRAVEAQGADGSGDASNSASADHSGHSTGSGGPEESSKAGASGSFAPHFAFDHGSGTRTATYPVAAGERASLTSDAPPWSVAAQLGTPDGEVGRENGAATATPEAISPREHAQRLANEPAVEMAAGKRSVSEFGYYELLEEKSRGGMGVVYRARHKRLDRQVALKMVLHGRFASDRDLQRFLWEAEALARLEHPSIVPMYDFGRHKGYYFFTMKFLEGGSLKERMSEFWLPMMSGSLAQRRGLRDRPTATEHRQRSSTMVALLTRVSQAVDFAHQRGLMHRDLKPANILFDSLGTPYVCDFGLAKRVDGDAVNLTLSGEVMGTPAYMAPEQASGDPSHVSIAADVFSLGAILYELVTRQPPYTAKSIPELLIQMATRDPVSPRHVNVLCDQNLETICLKALSRDPQRRYASAREFAEDLARWQRGDPINARPHSTMARLVHAVRRQPAMAAMVAAMILATAFFTGMLYVAYLRADDMAVQATLARNAAEQAAMQEAGARTEAERQARRAHAAMDYLRSWFDTVDPEISLAKDITVREVLDNSSRTITQAFVAQPEAELDVRHMLAMAYYNLGRYSEALPHAHRCVELSQQLSDGQDHPSVVMSLLSVVRCLTRMARHGDAIRVGNEALEMHDRLRAHPASRGPEFPMSMTTDSVSVALLTAMGENYLLLNRFDEAMNALERGRQVCLSSPAMTTKLVIENLQGIGDVRQSLGQLEAALAAQLEALSIARTLANDYWINTIAEAHVASVEMSLGRYAEALARHESLKAMLETHVPASHPRLGISYINLAICLTHMGRPSEALPLIEKGQAIVDAAYSEAHYTRAAAHTARGQALQALGRPADAVGSHLTALEMHRQLRPGDSPSTVDALSNVASCHGLRRRPDLALPYYTEALEMSRRLFPGSHPQVALQLNNMGYCLQGLGRRDEAMAYHQEALAMNRQLYPEGHPFLAQNIGNVAYALMQLSRHEEALALARESHEMLQRLLPGDHPRVADARMSIAILLLELQRPQEALPHAEHALGMWQRLHGPEHPATGAAHSRVAAVLIRLKRAEEAIDHLDQAQAIFARHLGQTHELTVQARSQSQELREQLARSAQ